MNATRSQVNDKLHGRSTSGSLLPTGRKNYMLKERKTTIKL
jgi:hypothetical protein